MATVQSTPVSDMDPPAPTFSYAQAARGRSTPQAEGNSSSKRTSEPSQSPDPNSSQQMPKPPVLAGSGRAQDGRAHEAVAEIKDELQSSDEKLNGKSELDMVSLSDPQSQIYANDTTDQAKDEPISPSQPAPGATIAPSKEDDVFAGPNDLGESTWDKISQESHNEDKQANKMEGDGDDSNLSSWEHVSAPAQFKEAPPPSFNVWEKRALDAKAKVKETNQSLPFFGSNIKQDVISASARKGSEANQDQNRLENRKKQRSVAQADEKGEFGPKDSSKPMGYRLRSGEDGEPRLHYFSSRSQRLTTDVDKAPQRGPRIPESGKIVTNMALPPPPGDEMSWPTPDLAKEEEKKKVHEKSERVEKEKTPSKPHGKEKWVQVPYVPTAVFNTPLPTSRRGGRGGGRGARDQGGRGGHSTNGSISAGDRSISGGTNVPATSERTRGDMGPPRPGPLQPRARRSASAGPPTSRDQRKPGDSRHDRRDETGQKPFGGSRAHENRRTSASIQPDGIQGSRRNSPPPGRRQQLYGLDREQGQQQGSQEHGYSRWDRRNDGMGRPQDYSRDTNGFAQHRERGEGRYEHGRGGFRGGRGGHNGFNGQSINCSSESHGHHGFTPTKSHSYNETRQPQSATFPLPRDGRHHRANSRSQSIPNPNGFGRLPANPSSAGSPHLPHLQTDVANLYGYQPPHQGVMSAVNFHPYMEHMQIQGMVQMQM